MALIITLGLDPKSFEKLDGLRRRYFPPERNFIPAHVSLFHSLPEQNEISIRDVLRSTARETSPFDVHFTSLQRLGRGFAIKVESLPLLDIHRRLAAVWADDLTAQDRQPFHPHVTLMNKASAEEAEIQLANFKKEWTPFSGASSALLLWTYLGGPWRLEEKFEW